VVLVLVPEAVAEVEAMAVAEEEAMAEAEEEAMAEAEGAEGAVPGLRSLPHPCRFARTAGQSC
jgi:hypothetical protein